MLGGFNREVQLIGNLLIAEALAEPAQHVFFPQAQHVAEGMGGAFGATVVVGHAGNHRIHVAAIALHGAQHAEQAAVADALMAAEPFALRLGRGVNRAEQRALNQHQAAQGGLLGLGGCHQGGAGAALELVAADQQISGCVAKAGEGFCFGAGGPHQGADAIKAVHQAADQDAIGGGHHDAAALQQVPVALGKLTHRAELSGEVHILEAARNSP